MAIEIVAYGPGVAMLKDDSKLRPRIFDALNDKVILLACDNTMQNQKIARREMIDGIGYVAAGVVHLIERQRQGWAYIRP